MADGDVLDEMRRRDAAMAEERERQRVQPMARMDFSALVADFPAATDEEIRAYEARMAREMWRDRLDASGIDGLKREDRAAILNDTLQPKPALDTVRRWLAGAMRTVDPGVPTLVLCGGMGTGKTVAAAWAISRNSGLYATTETFLRDFERWQKDRSYDDKTSPMWARYKRSHLVVLDELGTEHDAALMTRAFERLIDSRQSRRRELTLVITNLSRADFIGRVQSGVYGARTLDRLRAQSRVVEIKGESMRGSEW